MNFSILIPVHNEEKRIRGCLETLKAEYWGRYGTQIIISEDGSTDRTVEIAKEYPVTLLHSEKKLGQWGGIKRGLRYSNNPFTLITDVDLPVNPIMFSSAVTLLESYPFDFVIGERVNRNDPFTRRILSAGFHGLVRLLTGLKYDTQCGFRVVRTDVANEILQGIPDEAGFSYAVLFLAKAKRAGVRIVEFPVAYEYHENSSVNLRKDVARMLFDLLSLYWSSGTE